MSDNLNERRIIELAERCYNTNQYTFTDFLSLAEQSDYYRMERELSYVKATLFGGCDLSERRLIRFGSEDQLGYDQPFPISAIRVRPLIEKFSDDLGHRDFLGAIMNLGIERSVVGDIFIDGNTAYVFCLDSIAPYICENLSKIKHTSVMCELLEAVPDHLSSGSGTEKLIQVASMRIDAVVSRVYNLSRSDSLELFRKCLVFVDGRLTESNSGSVSAGQAITVRGYGKFKVLEEGGLSRKGKINIRVLVY